jgi:hypothetical protein
MLFLTFGLTACGGDGGSSNSPPGQSPPTNNPPVEPPFEATAIQARNFAGDNTVALAIMNGHPISSEAFEADNGQEVIRFFIEEQDLNNPVLGTSATTPDDAVFPVVIKLDTMEVCTGYPGFIPFEAEVIGALEGTFTFTECNARAEEFSLNWSLAKFQLPTIPSEVVEYVIDGVKLAFDPEETAHFYRTSPYNTWATVLVEAELGIVCLNTAAVQHPSILVNVLVDPNFVNDGFFSVDPASEYLGDDLVASAQFFTDCYFDEIDWEE